MSINKKYITQNREPFFEIARKLIQPGFQVLDIGAANGSFAKYCNNNDMYLLDGNEETVLEYSVSFKNFFYAKLPNIPFENNKFDLIHCSHVVEHLNPEDLYQTLKEFDRCLKFNGYLVISAPLLTDFFYNDLSHIKPYNPEVFIKYMVGKKLDNLSRTKISFSYILNNLVYRYRKEKIISGEFSMILDLLLRVLKKIGICKYIKTGFTIVLSKGTI